MTWEVEYTDEFEHWWSSLTEQEQEDIASSVALLEEMEPRLVASGASLKFEKLLTYDVGEPEVPFSQLKLKEQTLDPQVKVDTGASCCLSAA